MDGEHWVIVNDWDYTPDGSTWLVYPLPQLLRPEVIPVVRFFELELNREPVRLRAVFQCGHSHGQPASASGVGGSIENGWRISR